MNTQRIRIIIDEFKRACFKKYKTPLGRWQNHNYIQTDLKIKYANQDNCGTCCEYTIKKNVMQTNN